MTPASFSKVLAKTTIRKRNKLSKRLFEMARCFGSLPLDLNNTAPHANGITIKCRKFIAEGILSAVRTRGNRAVPIPNNVKLRFVTYHFGLDVDFNAGLIH
jgi:hypothetical protein